MNRTLRANLMLLTVAIIWGSAFVAQRSGMDYVGPFTFNAIRSIIGGLILIPVIFLLRKMNAKDEDQKESLTPEELKAQRKILIIGGVVCGIVLFIASSLQQIGIVYTTAGKTGFITALYIVIVPIFGIFVGRKFRPIIWLGVAFAVVGLYLLCIKEGFSIQKGDLLVILCAFGFATHILVIDHFSPKADGVKMSCIQFFACGIISIVPMFVFEHPAWSDILACWLSLCYAGILSCGAGYTLQIVAQKDTSPTIASMLLSLESVFAVIAGGILLNEQLAMKEIIGCIIMFTAVIIAQLPSKEERLTARNHE